MFASPKGPHLSIVATFPRFLGGLARHRRCLFLGLRLYRGLRQFRDLRSLLTVRLADYCSESRWFPQFIRALLGRHCSWVR